MTFDDILAQVLDLLQREKRVSYRALKRRFALDDNYLEDVKTEIIQAKRLAIDEDGVVIDVLLREHRDTASAQAFFRQAIERSGVIPHEGVTDRHQPYIKAVATACPGARHIRTGLHRARGATTKAVERSHVPTRDRLRNSRRLQRTETAQRFLEGFEAMRHLRRGGVPGGGHLVPGPGRHARVRQAVATIHALGRSLRRS